MVELPNLLEKIAKRVDSDFRGGSVTTSKFAEMNTKASITWYVATTTISLLSCYYLLNTGHSKD